MSCREVSWNLHCPVRFQWMSPRGCELIRYCNQAYHLVLLLCSVCRTSRFWQKDGISTGWSSLCILLIPKGNFGELFPPNQKYWKIVVGCKWRINKGICRGWNLGWWIIQILTVTLVFSKMCFPLSTTHLSTSSPIWAMIFILLCLFTETACRSKCWGVAAICKPKLVCSKQTHLEKDICVMVYRYGADG